MPEGSDGYQNFTMSFQSNNSYTFYQMVKLTSILLIPSYYFQLEKPSIVSQFVARDIQKYNFKHTKTLQKNLDYTEYIKQPQRLYIGEATERSALYIYENINT